MPSQQEWQMTLSWGNSSKEEHNRQKDGKKISSANLMCEDIFLWKEEIKKILPLLFLGNQCNRVSRK